MTTPTEDQLLILNSIIYDPSLSDYFIQARDKVTIYEWASQFDINSINDAKKPAEISREEFANIVNTIKHNLSVYDKMYVENIEQEIANPKGDKGDYVTNATITYGDSTIVVYKGTGGDLEWRDNGMGGYSNVTDTEQQKKALDYYERMKEIYGNGKDIYVTGHSKGGNKAQYVGVLKGDEIEHVYSFDGQGFGQAFLKKYRKQIAANKGKITSISNEFDFVNILLFSIAGEKKYIKSSTSFGILDGSSFAFDEKSTPKNPFDVLKGMGINAITHKFGGWHSPYSMFALKNGNVTLNDSVDQSDMMKEIQGLFAYYASYMDEEDFRFVIYSIMSLMMENPEKYGDTYTMPDGFIERMIKLTKGYAEKNKGFDFIEVYGILSFLFGIENSVRIWFMYQTIDSESYALLIRDFSDDIKQMLLNIVEEVDDEPWYDVTRWDILYKVDKFFGGLDFPSNSHELNEYYRKLIDIQGVSKKQIHEIFKKVHEKDSSFAKEIRSINKSASSINKKLSSIHNSFQL